MTRDQLETLIAMERQSREDCLAEFSSLSSQAELLEARINALEIEARTSRERRHIEHAEATSSGTLSIGDVQFMKETHSQVYAAEKRLEAEAVRLADQHYALTKSVEQARDKLGESVAKLKVLETRLEAVLESERVKRQRQDEEQ